MRLQFKRKFDSVASGWFSWLFVAAARLLGALLHRDHSLQPPPRRIIFIKILGLGSVFMAADAIARVRARYPDARLIMICGSGLRPGLEPLGLFDELWEIKDRHFGSLLVSALHCLWRSWRQPGHTWTVDLEVYSRLTSLFSLLTCAVNRFGFQLEVVPFRQHLHTHRVYFNRFRPIHENYLKLAEALGAGAEVRFGLQAWPVPRPAAPYRYLALNNTCSELSLERKLPEQQLAWVLECVLAQADYEVLLVGAPADAAAYERFLDRHPALRSRVHNRAGAWPFGQYYHTLYTHCAGMISIDSAPLHIARALGLPVLSFWGPTHPEHYLGARTPGLDQVVYLAPACSPCVHHTTELPCGGDNHCMKHLSQSLIQHHVTHYLHTLRPVGLA
jgi:ADP-heptose:LPS heptosyltransferase